MQLGDLEAGFPWGILLVSDAASREEIPSWATPEDQVAAASTALVVRVLHQDNGDVAIRVLDDAADATGDLAFSGALSVPSETLRISDALGDAAIEIQVPNGRSAISIYTDDPTEATEVDLILGLGSS